MSLLDFQEAAPWANAIKLALLEGRMPPFLPGDEGEAIEGARTLAARELDIVVDWASGATPEGESAAPEEAPALQKASDPDLVLRPKTDVVLAEADSEKTVCLALASGIEEPRVVIALEVFAREPSILRRAAILVGDSCSEAEPLAAWLPDRNRISFPEGLGRELKAHATLALEVRYVKGWGDEGKRMVDSPALGLWFSKDAAPVRTISIQETGLELGDAARLVSLYATSGDESAVLVEAIGPEGASRVLLRIDRFDPAWSEKYFFRTPIFLPAGSTLQVSRSGVWADLVSAAALSNP
jgi:hypothetical protein